MLTGMGVRKSVVRQGAMKMAPSVASGYVRTLLDRAIDGVGPLRPATATADAKLVDASGDVEDAVKSLIRLHVGLAAAEGFITNLGGVAALAVSIPANVVGVTLVQCRLIAGIAHLRGYDLDDPRVRNAILVCLLGEDAVKDLLKRKKIPAPPMALATAPAHDAGLDTALSAIVASDLITRVAGKRLATTIGRRVPVVGGIVGASADGYATWRIGRYADRELLPRAAR